MNFLTLKLEYDLATEYINNTRDAFNLPVTDLVRFDTREMIDAIETAMQEWK